MSVSQQPNVPSLSYQRVFAWTAMHRDAACQSSSGVGGHGCTRVSSGFTLVELMVSLTVLAILTVVAYPSMRDLMHRNRAVAQSNSIRSDLQFARGEAAATRKYVSICPLATNGSCDAAGKSYDLGWMVYLSATANAGYDASDAGSLLRQESAPNAASIRASVAGVLTFNSRGELLVAGVPSGAAVTFNVCSKTAAGDAVGVSTARVPGIQLSVSGSGRVASSKMAEAADCQSPAATP